MDNLMYVRFIGTKICWTILDSGRFYIGDREEASSEEIEMCESGGGELPVSAGIAFAAR